MHAPDRTHLKTIKQTIIYHRLTASTAFFGRLEDDIDCASKITCFRQIFGCPQQHGYMPVMAAGMHPPFDL